MIAGPLKVSTDLVRYAPGRSVRLTVVGEARAKTLRFEVYRAGSPLPNAIPSRPWRGRAIVEWAPPKVDGQGYLVVAIVGDARASCGVDVSSRWTMFPRYGYLAHYGPELAARAGAIVDGLADFHLNGLQFYDWQWRHQRPLSPDSEWRDIGNRPTSAATIRAFVKAAHEKGMACMAYNLGYGAVDGWAADGYRPEWRLFEDEKAEKPYAFAMPEGWATRELAFFDPANEGYQAKLFAAQRAAQSAFGFDGWHMDQVGNPGPRFDAKGGPITLKDRFPSMLAGAKRAVPGDLIFNDVGGYGLEETAKSPTDAMYVELWEWEGQRTYADLQAVVERARRSGKPTILTAYMDYELAKTREGKESGAFNPSGVLLADAVILASGATHLELGDDRNMLDHEYFPNRNLLPSEGLLTTLRTYYDFAVGYENLLAGHSVRPVEGLGVALEGIPTSIDGKKETVWAFARSDGDRTAIHLVNLLSADGEEWRDPHGTRPAPSVREAIRLKLPAGRWCRAFAATPDDGFGAPVELPIRDGVVVVPRLRVWTMVVLEPESP